ncbi:type II toxin-antitoxin system death-on-curing family toxin [Mycobacterium sp.]|uniref:type II toxin-antitoxin system death-on-curing family toxin n=1 Tax=Mycobacterium sp. TaxID=1785 RepID=UPI002B962EFB|nr:type II toxin-antitoxin system death-on-curing family toxin [Mycobacterium sp.]HTQ19413.1 type II toxin-antitoxin system death-on-curing family toxin [Mycobacterium sp.]
MIYLDLEDLLHIAERVLGNVEVRDLGLLEAAAARPRASAFGEDAYPSLHEKTAALIHSIARSHPLVDGNKRLALAAGIAFLGVNGRRLTMSNDEAYDLIISIATSQLDDIPAIAKSLARRTKPRRS